MAFTKAGNKHLPFLLPITFPSASAFNNMCKLEPSPCEDQSKWLFTVVSAFSQSTSKKERRICAQIMAANADNITKQSHISVTDGSSSASSLRLVPLIFWRNKGSTVVVAWRRGGEMSMTAPFQFLVLIGGFQLFRESLAWGGKSASKGWGFLLTRCLRVSPGWAPPGILC